MDGDDDALLGKSLVARSEFDTFGAKASDKIKAKAEDALNHILRTECECL